MRRYLETYEENAGDSGSVLRNYGGNPERRPAIAPLESANAEPS